MRVLALGPILLEIRGHDALDAERVLDPQAVERAAFANGSLADDVVVSQHADLIDRERAQRVRQWRRQQRHELRQPEGNG